MELRELNIKHKQLSTFRPMFVLDFLDLYMIPALVLVLVLLLLDLRAILPHERTRRRRDLSTLRIPLYLVSPNKA